ncbi:4-hydroxy-3-methylbut-2-enyl diphosphate reductase [compost metagenome]
MPSYLIADGSELDPAWVRDANVVGITAGASAPEEMVEDVIAALRKLGPVEVTTMAGREEHAEFRLPAELADVRPFAAPRKPGKACARAEADTAPAAAGTNENIAG